MEKLDKKPATINDVAAEAGVSITTVSRVLNNNYPVKQETRERIEKAIERLNYRPNIMARGMVIKRTSVIGVVVPGLTNLFFPTMVESIDSVISKRGYSIFLNSTSGDAEVERELVNKMISMQVDGIIVIDPKVENLDNGFYSRISETIPTIIINANSIRDSLNYICYNEESGTTQAFEYLVGLGHKNIAFIRGAGSFSYDIKERIYLDFIERFNLGYSNIIKVKHGNTIEGVQEVEKRFQELMGSEETPTAVFACNDLMAVGAMGACSNLGIRIPEDISIIGFDNTLLSKISYPRLTTVDLNIDTVGKRAATEMLSLIEEGAHRRLKVVLATNLVIRNSCCRA